MPTLAQLFDEFPDARFNIDLKSDGAVAALAEFVERARGLGPGAGRLVQPAAARRRSGGSPAAGCRPPRPRSRSLLFRFLPSGRLADRLTRRRVAALQIPHRRGRLPIASPAVWCAARTPPGKHVHVWTVDDPDEMRQLLDRGVDGLFTDRTDLLKDVLAERGNWRESTHDDH